MSEPVVYLIDDDPLVARSLEAALAQESGYEVEAFTAVEALRAALRRRQPDALVAGLRTSGVDGLAILAQVQGSTPAPFGLVMTRATDEEATARALAAMGPLGHVYIPCVMAELLPRLQAGLERQRLRRSLDQAESALARRDVALEASTREVERATAELRSTHTELRAATERLVQSEQLAAVGRVVTGIAYELSRQLTLVGYAEAIKSRVAHDPELVELADIIVHAQKRLTAMVDEIRDFVAAEGDAPGQLDREPADVVAVVDEALAIMGYDRDVRERVIKRRYRARPLAALHRHKFSQVVINLVSNAVLATAPGDTITVTLDVVWPDAQSDIQGDAQSDTQSDTQSDNRSDDRAPQTGAGPVAVFTVEDPGYGMPPEVLARLGEPFFTTRGDRGSGLGVGICMRIVEEHGGRLTFASEVGRGTTARVTVPLLPEPDSNARGPEAGQEQET